MYSLPNFSEQLTFQTLMRPIIGKWISSEEHIRFATIAVICLLKSIEANFLLIITPDWLLHTALWTNEVPKSHSYMEKKIPPGGKAELYPFQCQSLTIKLEWLLTGLFKPLQNF